MEAAQHKGTDWYSWLCRAGLDPELTYEYSLLFSQNELEEEDAVHFTHEFLLSMGVSIAKHRLEILKLAKKEKRALPQPVVRLLTAVKRTKRCIAGYVREMVRRPEESALVVVPPPARSASSYGASWRRAALKRGAGGRLPGAVLQGRLLLTNGSEPIPALAAHGHRRSSTCGDEDRFWENCDEGIRWDSMFHDLKPN